MRGCSPPAASSSSQLSFLGLMLLPVDFNYWAFAGLLALNGIGSGMFSAPNTTAIMNSVPRNQRGSASGMRATFFNSGTSLSIGVFFSLMIAGLAATLPAARCSAGCARTASRTPPPRASRTSRRSAACSRPSSATTRSRRCWAATGSAKLSSPDQATLTGHTFFPNLISGPFHHGLIIVFSMAIAMSLIGAVASLFRGTKYVHQDEPVAVDSREPVQV